MARVADRPSLRRRRRPRGPRRGPRDVRERGPSFLLFWRAEVHDGAAAVVFMAREVDEREPRQVGQGGDPPADVRVAQVNRFQVLQHRQPGDVGAAQLDSAQVKVREARAPTSFVA